ncbi:MAG: GntR family transcriptional regulator [Thermoanaerobaculia bacterium]|nr:GntR family transcriptional regulator [Thermoanaerobaculia bacterium]
MSRSTLAADVTHELERVIVSEEWPVGTKIPSEPELMSSLEVSRNTVREAVRALTHLGLLEARPGDGTYVRSVSPLACSLGRRLEGCSLEETLEARECLERQAARLAAQRRTEEDVVALREGFQALSRAFDGNEPTERLIDLIRQQERCLAHAGGNQLLVELFEAIADPVRGALRTLIDTVRETEIDGVGPRRLHGELVEAIAARDVESADRLVLEKSRLVRSWVVKEEMA